VPERRQPRPEADVGRGGQLRVHAGQVRDGVFHGYFGRGVEKLPAQQGPVQLRAAEPPGGSGRHLGERNRLIAG